MNAPATDIPAEVTLADLALARDNLRTQLKAVQDEEKRLKELMAENELAIIEQLDLRKSGYTNLAVYGHYGRPELNLPWERTDKVDAIKRETKRLMLN